MLQKMLSVLFLSFAVTVCLREVTLSHTKVPSEENWFLFWPGISAKKRKKKMLLSQCHLHVNFPLWFTTSVLQSFGIDLMSRAISLQVCSFASFYILETQIQRIHWDLFRKVYLYLFFNVWFLILGIFITI